MKLTRRELAAAALVPACAAAQEPAPANKELEAAREAVRRSGEALAKRDIPIETEPAFQFKP